MAGRSTACLADTASTVRLYSGRYPHGPDLAIKQSSYARLMDRWRTQQGQKGVPKTVSNLAVRCQTWPSGVKPGRLVDQGALSWSIRGPKLVDQGVIKSVIRPDGQSRLSGQMVKVGYPSVEPKSVIRPWSQSRLSALGA